MFPNTYRTFDDGETVTALGYDIVIRRRNVGRLELPTGELIACDPLNFLETEPFDVELEPGSYPVVLIIAELRDDNRVAYATLRVREDEAVRWERARLQEDEESNLLHFDAGYPVDSSVGAFMDAHTAGVLLDYHRQILPDDDDFERALDAGFNRHRAHGYSYATIDLRRDLDIPGSQHLNLITFETGYGPGLYETWIGRNADDQVCKIVTDFEVLDLMFNTFRRG
ncbi:MAG: DUF4241 domain-containing protein [Persicimonas sp.]